jgi:hypothetical protein
LTVDEIGAAVDVLWMRLSKHLDDPDFVFMQTAARLSSGWTDGKDLAFSSSTYNSHAWVMENS